MNNISLDMIKQASEAMKNDLSQGMTEWGASLSWQDGVKNKVKIRDFDPLRMDEPQTLGGTDTAPNPVEYLLAASVSCFAITFEVLASQKGIKLDQVDAEIKAGLNAAVFLGVTEGNGGILNPMISLKAKTSASREEVEEIAQIALSKSPVLASLDAGLELMVE